MHLIDNILDLHNELANHTYKHGGYKAFTISDPKPRSIHKARVRDRLLHHAIHRKLYPFFDNVFVADSYSCRIGKGTHKAINRFRQLSYIVSKNNTKTSWVLKCDIKKFFANIDHEILVEIIKKYIPDNDIIWLLEAIIKSFSSESVEIGLPLGNLTSQLFVNIYMNEFDQFMKHKLKTKYYIRYSDDFIILSADKMQLLNLVHPIREFLWQNLELELHPKKISVSTIASGVDFLGWIQFQDHRILRTATKRRMMERLLVSTTSETLNSYLGLLKHGNTHRIREVILNGNNIAL